MDLSFAHVFMRCYIGYGVFVGDVLDSRTIVGMGAVIFQLNAQNCARFTPLVDLRIYEKWV